MKFAFIATYPPRECGIGTFTNNLLDSVLQTKKARESKSEGFVIAVNDHDLTYDYPPEVKLTDQAGTSAGLFKSCKVY